MKRENFNSKNLVLMQKKPTVLVKVNKVNSNERDQFHTQERGYYWNN